MPDTSPTAGSNDFEVLEIEHGHRARNKHYERMTEAETYCDIDERRNATSPDRTTPGHRPEE